MSDLCQPPGTHLLLKPEGGGETPMEVLEESEEEGKDEMPTEVDEASDPMPKLKKLHVNE